MKLVLANGDVAMWRNISLYTDECYILFRCFNGYNRLVMFIYNQVNLSLLKVGVGAGGGVSNCVLSVLSYSDTV